MTGKILLVGKAGSARASMAELLARAHYDVRADSDASKVLAGARARPPDLALIDLAGGPRSAAESLALCRDLKSGHMTRSVPVILIADALGADLLAAGLECGADDFITYRSGHAQLLARLRAHIRPRAHRRELERCDHGAALGLSEDGAGFDTPTRIAVLAGDARIAARCKAELDARRAGICRIVDAEAAIEGRFAADVFITTADLASRNEGLRLLSDLRARPSTCDAATIVIVPRGDGDRAAIALDLGAADVLEEGFEPEELAIRVRLQLRHKRSADRVRRAVETGLELAVRDSLTGLYNRRHATHALDRLARSGSIAVMMLDLDFFKAVNDRFGHQVGDEVLVEVSRRLKTRLRGEDLIARIGGEEFLVAMPGADLATARKCAERLRLAISRMPVRVPSTPEPIPVTLSIGIAVAAGRSDTAERMVARADRALYDAKAQGRNLVTTAQPSAA